MHDKKPDTMFVEEEMHYVMEWGYMSIMHVAVKQSGHASETLCKKRVGFPSWANKVQSYVQLENYINEPNFEYMDNSDNINKATTCISCLKLASLKMMVSEATQ